MVDGGLLCLSFTVYRLPVEGPGRNRRRVLRGGSWNNNERNARCAYRNHNNPDNDNRNNGFRVVVGAGAAAHIFHQGMALPEMPDGATFLAEAEK